MPASLRNRLSPPLVALGLAILLFLLGGLIQPNFVNPEQAINIVRLAAFTGIIAAGQTLVIISGKEGIDLSVGGVVTLSAMIVFRFSNGDNNAVIPVLFLALGAGAVVGLVNGMGITFLNIPPLVMTLSMAGVIQGLILVITQGQPDGATPPIMGTLIANPLVGSLPGVIFIWIIFGLLMWLLLERTAYGKRLFAIGVNRTAARLSGVRVQRMVILTYALAGMLAAFGGFMVLGFTRTVYQNLGQPYLFPSIAAVVVGGTVLSGGKGSYFGTMAGALMLTVIESLLRAARVDEAYQLMLFGIILLALIFVYGRERSVAG
jgi:ribose transport system permease protein